MTRIRVLLCGLPAMLRDIVRNVVRQEDDLEEVGDNPRCSEFLEFLRTTEVDVVIVGCDETEIPKLETDVLGKHPHLRLLALPADGRRAVAVELRAVRVEFENISTEALLTAIRG